MGLFHTKNGISVGAAQPEKGKLKDKICLDFCSHTRKCSKPHQVCTNGKHYTHWNRIPDEDKTLILAHCNSTGKMWLDAETFKKHEVVIPPQVCAPLEWRLRPKAKGEKEYVIMMLFLLVREQYWCQQSPCFHSLTPAVNLHIFIFH